MCFNTSQRGQIQGKDIENTDIDISEEVDTIPSTIPEHVDNPFLDRNLKTGILGFTYENRNQGLTIVYSSVEAKTFCKIMKIVPVRNSGALL